MTKVHNYGPTIEFDDQALVFQAYQRTKTRRDQQEERLGAGIDGGPGGRRSAWGNRESGELPQGRNHLHLGSSDGLAFHAGEEVELNTKH